jgi:hypothetical protein
VEANRRLIDERLVTVLGALADGAGTAVELVPVVFGEPLTEYNAPWRLQETLCYLRHLEARGRVAPAGDAGEASVRWRLA